MQQKGKNIPYFETPRVSSCVACNRIPHSFTQQLEPDKSHRPLKSFNLNVGTYTATQRLDDNYVWILQIEDEQVEGCKILEVLHKYATNTVAQVQEVMMR